MVTIAIISTGDELLNGYTIDTNSQYISNVLTQKGFSVLYHLTIGDNCSQLVTNIKYSLSQADIVIISGGLGPTDDDNTIKALQQIVKFDTIIDKPSFRKMETFFASIDLKISESDTKMVEVPKNCVVLENNCGLAPGFVVTSQDKTVICIPGVPKEMTAMLDNCVVPYLQNTFTVTPGSEITFRVTGMKESRVNELINTLNIDLNAMTWGITAKFGIYTIRFLKTDGQSMDTQHIKNEMRQVFDDNLLFGHNSTIEEEVLQLLKEYKKTLGTAESCTGGLIAKQLTDIAGSSAAFIGSIIAYNNSVKTDFLSVKQATLNKFGAVSEETASEMVIGIKNIFGADINVSTTGIAGPGGGSSQKPVGTVCFGFAIGEEIVTRTKHFPGDRERVRRFAALYAADYIRRKLRKIQK